MIGDSGRPGNEQGLHMKDLLQGSMGWSYGGTKEGFAGT